MTPVLFLELKMAAKERLTCDLIEKLYQEGQTIALYTREAPTANKMNLLLWSWKQETFLPHALYETGGDNSDPIIIYTEASTIPPERTLVLFDPLPPEELRGRHLVIDFAEVYHEQKKQESRQRFRALKNAGDFELSFLSTGAFMAQKKRG